ncbi:hypothetical protein BH09BAC2_BH09BAC2_13140 [soil metagenome]
MSKKLELFNTLLFIDCPWHDKNPSENKFQQQLHKLPKVSVENQPLLELKFLKPLSERRKYYSAIIKNEAVSYLNAFHKTMKAEATDDEKKYQVHKSLVKQLRKKLKETESIVASKGFSFQNIEPAQKKLQGDSKFKEDVYIIQLLKYQLIWLYLEIQNSYLPYLSQDVLEESDFYEIFFSEPEPDKSLFAKAPELNLPKLVQPVMAKEKGKPFIVQKKDFRDPAKSVLTYDQLIANPDKFAQVEREFFEQGLINDQYKFKEEHNQVKEFAAAYQVLQKKNYFNKYYFPGKKKVSDLHIRKFLNHRYIAKIDREFRNFKNKNLLEDYLDTKPWISLILPS